MSELTIDRMPPAEAAAALAPLFEGAPDFLYRLIAARPFGTWEHVFERAREIAQAMPEPLQIELVDAHPRLGAPWEGLSAASAREQAASGTGATPAAVVEALARLNRDYEARFGFRYCAFVAGRPLAAFVPELEAALGADRDHELHRGLDAVVDIARARHEADRHEAPSHEPASRKGAQ